MQQRGEEPKMTAHTSPRTLQLPILQWLLYVPPAVTLQLCVFHANLTVNSDYFPNGITQLVFVKETESVYCEVRTELLHIVCTTRLLKSCMQSALETRQGTLCRGSTMR